MADFDREDRAAAAKASATPKPKPKKKKVVAKKPPKPKPAPKPKTPDREDRAAQTPKHATKVSVTRRKGHRTATPKESPLLEKPQFTSSAPPRPFKGVESLKDPYRWKKRPTHIARSDHQIRNILIGETINKWIETGERPEGWEWVMAGIEGVGIIPVARPLRLLPAATKGAVALRGGVRSAAEATRATYKGESYTGRAIRGILEGRAKRVVAAGRRLATEETGTLNLGGVTQDQIETTVNAMMGSLRGKGYTGERLERAIEEVMSELTSTGYKALERGERLTVAQHVAVQIDKLYDPDDISDVSSKLYDKVARLAKKKNKDSAELAARIAADDARQSGTLGRLLYEESGELTPGELLKVRTAVIRDADPSLSAREAFRLARKENKRPGYLLAQAQLGRVSPNVAKHAGIPPRTLGGEFPVGDLARQMAGYQSARPWARSGPGRVVQRAYDQVSRAIDQKNPNWRFGSSVRGSRAVVKQMDFEQRKIDNQLTRLQNDLDKLLGKETSRFRNGSERMIADEALRAALQGSKSLSHEENVKAKIGMLKALFNKNGEPLLKRQYEMLEMALENGILERPQFQEAFDRLLESLKRSEKMFSTITGRTGQALETSRNAAMIRMQEAGFIPADAAGAHAYLPERALYDTLPTGGKPMTGVGAVTDVVGQPRAAKGVLETRENKGINFRRGNVNSRSKLVVALERGRARLHRTYIARNILFEAGKPLDTQTLQAIRRGEEKDLGLGKIMIVRRPTGDLTDITEELRMFLSSPNKWERVYHADLSKELILKRKEELTKFLEEGEVLDDFWWVSHLKTMADNEWTWTGKGKMPDWVNPGDLSDIRVVPERVARTLLGDAFIGDPRGTLLPLLGTANAAARAVIIHLPDFGLRYVARNTVQGLITLSMTNPVKLIGALRFAWRLRRNPESNDIMRAATGSIRGVAGMPEITQGTGRIKNVERQVTALGRKVAEFLGQLGDEPWRDVSFAAYMRDYGIKDVDDLIAKAKDPKWRDVFQQTSQYVREDMMDFDVMPTYMRERVGRAFFLSGFLAGAGKWPIIFARDYPVRATLLGAAIYMMGDDAYRELEDKFGWAIPWDPAVGLVRTGRDTPEIFTEGNWDPLIYSLNPSLRQAGKGIFGFGKTPQAILASTFDPTKSTRRRIGESDSLSEWLLKELGYGEYYRPLAGSRGSGSFDKYKNAYETIYGVPLSENAKLYWEMRRDYEKNAGSGKHTEKELTEAALKTLEQHGWDISEAEASTEGMTEEQYKKYRQDVLFDLMGRPALNQIENDIEEWEASQDGE